MKNIVFPVKYTKDGEEKTRWLNCGKFIEKDWKQYIKLDSIPVEFNGWFNVFEQDDSKKKDENLPF